MDHDSILPEEVVTNFWPFAQERLCGIADNFPKHRTVSQSWTDFRFHIFMIYCHFASNSHRAIALLLHNCPCFNINLFFMCASTHSALISILQARQEDVGCSKYQFQEDPSSSICWQRRFTQRWFSLSNSCTCRLNRYNNIFNISGVKICVHLCTYTFIPFT